MIKSLFRYIFAICIIFTVGCSGIVYVVAFIEEMLGDPKEIGEEYPDKTNESLDKLIEENEDEVQILIK